MSNTTKVTLYNEATISARGKKRNTNAKPVFCIDTGVVYASSLDVAEQIGVSPSTVSWVLTGRQQTCKGKRYCFVSQIPEYLDEITTAAQLRENKAVEYDKIVYRKQAIDNANVKLEKHKENLLKLKQKLQEEEQAILDAERELAELTREG